MISGSPFARWRKILGLVQTELWVRLAAVKPIRRHIPHDISPTFRLLPADFFCRARG